MTIHAIILAAGQGTRMRSARPKVLQTLAGRSLLAHVIERATAVPADHIHIVHGHGGDQVRNAFSGQPELHWVEQTEQLGTGHAVAQALPNLPDEDVALVLYGDVPLVDPAELRELARLAGDGALAVLGVRLVDPAGYGRLLRDEAGQLTGIVEHKDASRAQRAIDEVNTGLLAAPVGRLKAWAARLGNDNAQGEYYLTDCVGLAAADGVPVRDVMSGDPLSVSGINDRAQQAALERAWQARQAGATMAAGVQLLDPARFDLRGRLEAGRDCCIDVGCVLSGEVMLGDEVVIGAHCVLHNVRIADGARIEPHSVLEDAELGPDCRVGPFARLRPGTRLAAGARVGNFVETKKAEVGEGSKINHLSYVGDARIGRDVNVGAGTITCNYDGVNKSLTVIEDGAFIGSDTALVAPVTVGARATIGAGSVISRDAPADRLTVARGRQRTVEGWKRPVKREE